jgi:hypothetical protein
VDARSLDGLRTIGKALVILNVENQVVETLLGFRRDLRRLVERNGSA